MAEALGGLAGSVQSFATGMFSKVMALIDTYFPPERRAQVMGWFQKFMSEKPMLASFLLSHIAISGIPLGLFVLMTITVGIFAILAALLIGLLGALLFIVFCVGIALIFLLPTLFFTTLVATFLFLWGVGTYYIIKWFNEKEIPGIHKPLSSVLEAPPLGENAKLGALNPDPSAADPGKLTGGGNAKGGEKSGKGQSGGSEGKAANGSASNDEMLNKVSKATGMDLGSVGDMKKKVNVGDVSELRKKVNTSSVDDLKKELGVAGAS